MNEIEARLFARKIMGVSLYWWIMSVALALGAAFGWIIYTH